MTRLKIEVTADDDGFATQILRDILQHWKDAGSLSAIQGAFTCGLSVGTATATVEREQGGSEPCDAI